MSDRADLKSWEAAFSLLYTWMDSDRDRRSTVIEPDDVEIWRVFLYIDEQIVQVATGVDLPSTIEDAMAGIVVERGEGNRP